MPPYRPPIALDGVLTLGLLPEDHPHGRKFHFSPVDFGILKSPKIAHKIKLKMSRKSSRTLRKELAQLTDEPYDGDAHAMTSNEVVCATLATPLGGDGARDFEAADSSRTYRAREQFGTVDETSPPTGSRPDLHSPSLYSRSQSRIEGESGQVTESMGGRRILAGQDFLGQYYRSVLDGRPSLSTLHLHSQSGSGSRQQGKHDRQISDSHSRQWSGSTESTIRRRLEQAGIDSASELPIACSLTHGSRTSRKADHLLHPGKLSTKSAIVEVEHKEEV